MGNDLVLLVQKAANMLKITSKKIILCTFCIGSFLISCKNESTQVVPKNEKAHSNNTSQSTSKEVSKLPYFNSPDFAPIWLPNTKQLQKLHKIPDFVFTNQLNQKISNTTLEGKIYIANFFFTTCPNVCLQLTKSMHALQEMFAKDDAIRLISHTVMPSVDTVEVLREYGERQNVDPKKWSLVTGEKEKIYTLAREAYFADDLYKQTNDKNRFVHTENLMLIDKNGHIRGVYNGTLAEEVKRIQRHIQLLKKE